MEADQGIAGINAAVDQRVSLCGSCVGILHQAMEVNRGAGVGGKTARKRVVDRGSRGAVPADRGTMDSGIGDAGIHAVKEAAEPGNARDRLNLLRNATWRYTGGGSHLRMRTSA